MSISATTGGASSHHEFGKIRKILWPIHNHELKKFLPLSFIMFCILFNYTLLRDTKDSLIVNSASSGAGAVTFLKLYCVTPAAVLFVVLYAKLTNLFTMERVFYTIVTPFLLFYGLFALVIYPNFELLHPSAATVDYLHATYPRLRGFIDIYALWSYSLFFVLAEIWGSAMIALTFWQFANQIVRINESKRFYGLFAVIGNLSLILSGQFVKTFSNKDNIKQMFGAVEDPWQIALYFLMGGIVVMGIFAMLIYRWVHVNVLTDPFYYDGSQVNVKSKKKKPGMIESMKLIAKSPEVGLIAMLIVAYGFTINLVEVQWKEQLKMFANGDKNVYNAFMGDYSTITGIFTILFGLFIGSNIIRIFSWFVSAVITPMVILLGGAFFFSFILADKVNFIGDFVYVILNKFNITAVTAATFLGAGIIIASKAIKYTLFDPTKEMAYIPLDDELKSKGKAAADVIGGRGGKAGGSLVQSTLISVFAVSSVTEIASMAYVAFLVMCVAWIYSVKLLSVKVANAMAKRENELNMVASANNRHVASASGTKQAEQPA